MMREELQRYMERLFEGAPKTQEAIELKEEFCANLLEKFDDLVAGGENQETAYRMVVDSIGDVSELFSGMGRGGTIRQNVRPSGGQGQPYPGQAPHGTENSLGKIAGVCVGAVALMLVIVVVIFMGMRSGNHDSWEYGGGYWDGETYSSYSMVNSQSVNMEGIDSIAVLYASEDIEILTSSSDEIIIKEYMKIEPAEQEKAKISVNGGTLEIKSGERPSGRNISNGWFSVTSPWGYTEIYLPASYQKALSIGTTSGDITDSGTLSLSVLDLMATSGDIWIKEVGAEDISASTTSGDIEFSIADGLVHLSSTSGDIWIDGGTGHVDAVATSGEVSIMSRTGNVDIETTSGDVETEGYIGAVKISTTSGEVNVQSDQLLGDLDIRTTSGGMEVILSSITEGAVLKAAASSGSVNFWIPEDTALTFYASTGSGGIDTFFDEHLSYNKRGNEAEGTVGSNPAVNMEVSAGSGDVFVGSN